MKGALPHDTHASVSWALLMTRHDSSSSYKGDVKCPTEQGKKTNQTRLDYVKTGTGLQVPVPFILFLGVTNLTNALSREPLYNYASHVGISVAT